MKSFGEQRTGRKLSAARVTDASSACQFGNRMMKARRRDGSESSGPANAQSVSRRRQAQVPQDHAGGPVVLRGICGDQLLTHRTRNRRPIPGLTCLNLRPPAETYTAEAISRRLSGITGTIRWWTGLKRTARFTRRAGRSPAWPCSGPLLWFGCSGFDPGARRQGRAGTIKGTASLFVADSGATQDFTPGKSWSGLKTNAIAAGIDRDPRPLRAQRQSSWARALVAMVRCRVSARAFPDPAHRQPDP